MENLHLPKKVLSPAHLPTALLVIGYPVYWLELYIFKVGHGRTTLLASILFLLVCFCVLARERKEVRSRFTKAREALGEWGRGQKFLVIFGICLSFFILSIGFYAALLPPHLIQEFDALNYHITIPRQHLITGSFQHISWSLADLYFLPIDYALAPYWLCTELPSKFPQFLFLLGLILLSKEIVSVPQKKNAMASWMIVFAILGSHSVVIQMGTAMLDLVVCYLFLAAWDSFLKGNIFLCAVEFAFFFWSKSFVPLQLILIVLGLWGVVAVLGRLGFHFKWNINSSETIGNDRRILWGIRRFFFWFLVMSVFVGGPFIAKSLRYARTPLFPFLVGRFSLNGTVDQETAEWKSLVEKARQAVSTRDQYGSGRSFKEFVKHLWLIAVPEDGVNNRYDYPLGLVYLLCLGPFIWTMGGALRNKNISILQLFVLVYWLLWWCGSQQTRFLYIPLVLMMIAVISQERFHSRIFLLCLVVSLCLESLSAFRTHRVDFGKKTWDVLRLQDRQLLEMSKSIQRNEVVKLNMFDVAYAGFAVEVVDNDSIFVLNKGH